MLGACSYSVELPEPRWQRRTSRIQAADGSLLVRLHGSEDRAPVPLDRMSPTLRQAIVAAEDRRFWQHSGIDLRAIARAVLRNTEAAAVQQGGSTITQQYVKNVYLDDDEALRRKLREVMLARTVEKRYVKEEILERYLNTVYFGNGAYGVEAAARRYFGKRAAELGLAESAFLAGVVRGPELYDPRVDPARAKERRDQVLTSMVELRMITSQEAGAASAAPLQLRSDEEGVYAAPHFVEDVKRFLLDDARFGATVEERRKRLFGGGAHHPYDARPPSPGSGQRGRRRRGPRRRPGCGGGSGGAGDGRRPRPRGWSVLLRGRGRVSFQPGDAGPAAAGSAFKPFALVAALEQGISR